MFSDPFSALMVLIVLNFTGMCVIFIFGMRNLENMQSSLREMHLRLETGLLDVRQALKDLEYSGRKIADQDARGQEDLAELLENAREKVANLPRTLNAWEKE